MAPNFAFTTHLRLKLLDDRLRKHANLANCPVSDLMAAHHLEDLPGLPIRLGFRVGIFIDDPPGLIHLPRQSGWTPIRRPILVLYYSNIHALLLCRIL